MSQTWSVMINGNTPASFDPDVFGIPPGQPLKAQIGDLVSWNNQTESPHQIQVKKNDGTPSFTTKEIPKRTSSSPGYVLQAGDNKSGTISYICLSPKHEGERGTITVVTS